MGKKYIKSKSNYVIKNNPNPTDKGYIYENDWLTTVQNYSTSNGNLISSTSGGFSLVSNVTSDDEKNYNTNGWLTKSYTLNDIVLKKSDLVIDSNENVSFLNTKKYVSLEKNYVNLIDFCYFGSANQMLKSAVTNVINNFPAGLYISNVNNILIGENITIPINDIENYYNLDLFNYTGVTNYSIRILSSSFTDYVLTDGSGNYIGDIIGFTGVTNELSNNINIKVSNFQNASNYFIKPKDSLYDDFFENLDDFEKTLLNRYSVPKYKTYLTLPIENENGVSFDYKELIWPTLDGYNLDCFTSFYVSYISDLIDATNFVDETFCDNLYRMLTHDTIKNLDFAYQVETDENKIDDIIIGGTKVQKILRLYGRMYDEIKKYIEGISFVNTITYDNKNNIPLDYLNGKLDMSGWDGFSLAQNIDSTVTTSQNLFSGINKKYTTLEVNDELFKKLIINSKYIFKSKGTKKSIRKLLGLLGFENDWYTIKEYIQEIDNYISGTSLEKIAKLNYDIYPEIYSVSDGRAPYEYYYDQSLFDNTNLGIFVKCPYCGSYDYYADSDSGVTGTCINCKSNFIITGSTIGYPKPLANSNDYYFQSKGGWYRETGGNHNDFSGTTNYVNEITYGNNPHTGYDSFNDEWYDFGYDYIEQFNDLFKRFIRNSNEVSVVDITAYTTSNYDNFGLSKKKTDSNKIQYFNDFHDGDLILNLKNLVIGLDGDKILNSFSKNNENIDNVTLLNVSGVTITPNSSFVLINKENENNFNLIINNPQNKDIKLIIKGNTGGTINLVSGSINSQILVNTNYIIKNNLLLIYHGDDEVNLLKSIAMPYIEQLIPSTTIFDMYQIKNNSPKWVLVDKYLYRTPETGFYDGDTILVYQNINYFDEYSEGYNAELTELIKKDYGSGFSYFGSKLKNNQYGYDNIYMFKGKLYDSIIDTNPIWAVDENLI